jgi:hypothetical protein
MNLSVALLKGTVQRDFFTPVFSLHDLSWSQYMYIPRKDVQFRRIFVELFVFEIPINQLPAEFEYTNSKSIHIPIKALGWSLS